MLMSGHFNAVFTMGQVHPLGVQFASFRATWFEPYQRIAEPTSGILSQITSSIRESYQGLVHACKSYYTQLFTDSSLSSETRLHLHSALDLAVSTAVYQCVYPQFFDLIQRVYWAENTVHAAKMEELRRAPLCLRHLGLSRAVERLDITEGLLRCATTLRTIQSKTAPALKLRVVLDVLRQVARCAAPIPIAADDLLPLLCYVVVYSGTADIFVQTAFIERFGGEDGYGESGYALATLQAALAAMCFMDARALEKAAEAPRRAVPIKISVAELDEEDDETNFGEGIPLSTFSALRD